ncbi:MAG: CPBP family intramembrane metalloprotease [Ignavibacteriales bacterium]|nr:MAG: CPBP family intramembrane metalloprotease [Ignavibacteriales bacterium]
MENEDFNINNEQPDPDKRIAPRISPTAAAYLGLISVFIFYQFGGSLLTLLILGTDIKNADVMAVRLLTTAGQILFILLPALIFAKTIYEDVTEILRVKTPAISHMVLFSIGLVLLSVILQSYLYIQNYVIIKLAEVYPFVEQAKSVLDKFDKLVEESYSNLLTYNSAFEAVLIVIVVAIIPAVCEESFFRGYVQSSFGFKLKPFKAALLTGIFFGIYHFNPYQVLPLIVLGVYFGFAAYKTNSIFVPMFLHFLNNFLAVLMSFTLGKEEISTPVTVSFNDFQISAFTFIGFLIPFILILYFTNRLISKSNLSVVESNNTDSD